ncbi:hypothetical protein AKJ35_00355 [candidate division MSBL1 archaeon SCGC-AAA833F18]|uniref:Mut7-C RNAse domain-containing protein n=3 Tax=candidate division MSBL1 TaxID=215777 RepID=A0A133VT38_9EURY|nr:hypothetical protein AKJ48_01535 [candidate division MSBL1 archaeon SCGC-AAA261O19]KXB09597.1 hypothetical protein AKJ35_00355 [candidate division MSBL1 archaeon SCGC-AAA833F18]
MKFIVDSMLGKLARWLRLAGQDVIYANDFPPTAESQDESLLLRAKEDYRILLTRDLELHRQAISRRLKSIYLEDDDVVNQLVEVSNHCEEDVRIDLTDSRCPVCNGELNQVGKEEVSGRVPENLLEEHEDFWICMDCGKIYWPGTHWETIAKIAEEYEEKLG